MSFNIFNNRPFYYDFITEGWTKKDWALNLLPLGGVASVVYEMGSALCTRDRTTKIAQDFFKSPTHTAIKKLAQCLWFPIIACGAIKLVSIIVTACWNRCFPPAYKELQAIATPTALDFNGISVPKDICLVILSFLTLEDLAKCRWVSKPWHSLTSTPHLWKEAIYREIAFTSQDWAQHSEGIVKAEDRTKEISSLPDDIVRELNKSYKAFPGKKLIESHVLVRISEGLTIKKLGDIAKKYFPSNVDGYRYIWKSIMDELGDKPIDEPCWVLMTKDVLPGSRNKSYTEQQALVAGLAKKASVPYVAPTTGKAIACIFAYYLSKDKERLFGDNPRTYTRCQENRAIVGGFALAGLRVSSSRYGLDYIGVAALRKF